MINLIKNLYRAKLIGPIIEQKYRKINIKKKYNFGKLNKNKIFYIIRRNFNSSGIFSNITFVIDHINYAKKKNYIPVIDMKNFPTVYNEKNLVNRSKNSWDYYFKPLNKYKLNNVYKSANVYFSKSSRITNKEFDQDKRLQKIFFKNIFFKKEILKEFQLLYKKYFKKNDKIMGVHVRGTLQRIVTKHSYPPNPKDLVIAAKKIFKKNKCNKLILVTEDKLYLKYFKKNFNESLIYIDTPRSEAKMFGSHNQHFEDYNRKNHRYKLGKETIIDCLLLSNTDVFLYTDSNVWRFAVVISNKKQKKYEFKLSINSKFRIIARWKWYLKYYFPFIFGKLKFNIISSRA